MAALDSLYLRNAAEWPALYDAVFAELGNTATICNFGDQRNAGLVSATTFTGRKFNASGLSPTWTWATAPSTWATPFDLKLESNWQGVIPILTPDGTTNNIATAPDDNYWSFNNNPGTNTDKAFSMGWIWKPTSTAANRDVLGKYAAAAFEYEIAAMGGTAVIEIYFRDSSVPVVVSRKQNVAFALGQWHTFAVTYDGGGGATAMNGVVIYMDGAVVASTAGNNANYVAMENGTELATLGHRTSGTPLGRWIDPWAGGPLGPWVTLAAITAANVKNLYDIGRLAMGV